MTEKTYLRTERGQRIDQPDFQHAIEVSPKAEAAQLLEELVRGPDGPATAITGWSVTTGAGSIIVGRGTAVTGYRENGRLYRAAILAGGPAERTLSVGSFPDGTYGVYVRLSFRPSVVRNRRVWDATATPSPLERARVQATRVVEDWDLVVEINNPGDDFLLLGTIPILGGSPGSFTAARALLFDSNRANRSITDAEWGSAADRSVSGPNIFGLVRWTRMVMRQIQDIIGGPFFGTAVPNPGVAGSGAKSLSALNADKLDRDGSTTITGDITPSTTGTRSLGSSLLRFLRVWADQFRTGDGDVAIFGNTSSDGNKVISFTGSTSGRAATWGHYPTGGTGGNGLTEIIASSIRLAGSTDLSLDSPSLLPTSLSNLRIRRIFTVSASSTYPGVIARDTPFDANFTVSPSLGGSVGGGGSRPAFVVGYTLTGGEAGQVVMQQPYVSAAVTNRIVVPLLNPVTQNNGATLNATFLVVELVS